MAAGCSTASAEVKPIPGLEYPDGRPVALRDNPEAVNVTFAELNAFLATVDKPQGTCLAVAVALHDQAEAQGIRAGISILRLPAGSHAVTIFQAADEGIVYADFNYDRQLVNIAALVDRYHLAGGVYEFWY